MKDSRRRRIRIIRLVIIFLITAVSAVIFLELRMKPLIADVAMIQARGYVINIVNEAALEVMKSSDSTPEEVRIRSDGSLAELSADTASANRIKNELVLKAQKELENICTIKADIPLGSVMGIELINAAGLSLPVYISLSGTVTGDFEDEFESGGINQTVHKLSVRLVSDIKVLLPSGTAEEKIETSVLIGETVIIGSTPDGMLYGMRNAAS